MGRLVTLVLVTPGGRVLGSLPPYPVETPWWSEVASVVAGARAHHGADVTVLRLLAVSDAEPDDPDGAVGVVYLAEIDGAPPPVLGAEEVTIEDDPRRAPWARPGGPAADLAWADGALLRAGRSRTGPAVQQRTWNLSSIWRMPTTGGDAWLKVVPELLAHEGAVLEALAREGAPVPTLIASGAGGRVLLDHVGGENQWRAGTDRLVAMVGLLRNLQAAWCGRESELLALGVADWRPPSFVVAAQQTVGSWSGELAAGVRATLDRLVEELPQRFAALESCGLPDSLVHGDFHPGNVRFDGTSLVLLDWGDCGIGHPLLDMAGFVQSIDVERRRTVERAWLDGWAGLVPGSDPYRAAALVRPLAALRRAAVYHRFVEAFEPSERRYHCDDVPRWLAAAAAAPAP